MITPQIYISKSLKRTACLAVTCAVLCSQLFATSSQAASQDWSLCRTNGSGGEWVTHCTLTFTTKKATTKVTCERVGGGADVHVNTENGIHCHFDKAGSASTSTAIGYTYEANFGYEKVGTSANNPYGKLIY